MSNPKNHLYLGIIFPLLGFLLSFPNFIPNLEEVFFGLVVTFFGVGAFFLLKFNIDYYKKEKNKQVYSILRIFMVSFVLWGSLSLLVLLTALFFGNGFLGPTYVYTKEFTEENLVFYVYDASFLKPATTVKVKNKKFPFLVTDLIVLIKGSPNELEIQLKENKIYIVSNNTIKAIYDPTEESVTYK